jgi:hypothetical protein
MCGRTKAFQAMKREDSWRPCGHIPALWAAWHPDQACLQASSLMLLVERSQTNGMPKYLKVSVLLMERLPPPGNGFGLSKESD